MAKKGKKKKQKPFHPILVAGGIFLILVVTLSVVWFYGGKTLFVTTPGVEKNFDEAITLYEQDLEHVQDAKAIEDRLKGLLGKSGNKDIIKKFSDEIGEHITFVEKDNAKLNLAVIALDQMSVPLSMKREKRHLTNGTEKLTEWKMKARDYYDTAMAYYQLVANITDYKEQVAGQTFDKQNSNDGIASHTKMKEISESILSQASKLSEDLNIELTNVVAYFEKAKAYHEKNIAFYEADKKSDVASEKTLTSEATSLKNDLSKMDPVSDLADFESSHLSDSRATLDDVEREIENDFTIFKD